MKQQGLLSTVKMIVNIASRFARQHSSSLDAMEYEYISQEPHEDNLKRHLTVVVKISAYGSIYKVTQMFYLNDEVQREHTWLATYGWHSNGHLIEIGGYRYCIFDPLQRKLYIEGYNDADIQTVEIYIQK